MYPWETTNISLNSQVNFLCADLTVKLFQTLLFNLRVPFEARSSSPIITYH